MNYLSRRQGSPQSQARNGEEWNILDFKEHTEADVRTMYLDFDACRKALKALYKLRVAPLLRLCCVSVASLLRLCCIYVARSVSIAAVLRGPG